MIPKKQNDSEKPKWFWVSKIILILTDLFWRSTNSQLKRYMYINPTANSDTDLKKNPWELNMGKKVELSI